uniref:Uncharacterized protein n=1 Tax=uncultured gamma proteobacterium EB080_L93H08 TaxID=710973 RepID=E0Y2V0_9GAMM|nr:hypothetical protein [uncultured gamma proteobacterium EB080_L93H08]
MSPNNDTPISDFIRQLIVPILKPIQKRLPYPAGFDFSPVIAIVYHSISDNDHSY